MDTFTSNILRIRNRHLLAIDLVIFLLTPAIALSLRTDDLWVLSSYGAPLLLITGSFALVKFAVFQSGKLYSRFWRYASIDELGNIAALGLVALVLQTLLFGVFRTVGWVDTDFPRSLPIIEGIIATIAVGAVRYSLPLAERLHQRHFGIRDGERVVVAGARSIGVMIVQEMQAHPKLGMVPVAFVEDDPEKQGMRIRGVPVLGGVSSIPRVCRETKATKVIIAVPAERGKMIRDVVRVCEEAEIPAKIVPAMHEMLEAHASLRHLRDVQIEDLLRREPVRTDVAAVAKLVRGKRVLVTGGGGSIGSELCRQLLQFQPEMLVILGHGENSVFEIHSELTRLVAQSIVSVKGSNGNGHSKPGTRIESVIADIRSADRMFSVLDEYRPEVVFHSAAHKHVPLMELNPTEAVTNNIIGTRNLLGACQRYDVQHFVMISTDKAVNPTSVMGASKRVAELLVHEAAHRSDQCYVAVRFGNVLGSRGSVLFTFKQQIAAGGPVTVTHPEMKRYFMTIPEAVQLVLQAATLGRGGEVFMLDMGEPIKIVDLAQDIIELSGLRVGRDIDIVHTGLRPGEKLFEEMFAEGERYERTRHEKVLIARNASNFVPPWLEKAVADLEEAAQLNNRTDILVGLKLLVPEFEPTGESAKVLKRQTGPLEPLWPTTRSGGGYSWTGDQTPAM